MSKQTHTSGPWRADLTRGEQGYSDSYTVAGPLYEVCRMVDLDEEDAANARLIAAAPDLLEVARTALMVMEDLNDMIPTKLIAEATASIQRELRAAIAKAEGV